MRLNTALRKLCIQIIWHPWCKINHFSILSSFLFHLFEFFQFLLLDNVSKFFTYQFKFLLIEYVNLFIEIVVQPLML